MTAIPGFSLARERVAAGAGGRPNLSGGWVMGAATSLSVMRIMPHAARELSEQAPQGDYRGLLQSPQGGRRCKWGPPN